MKIEVKDRIGQLEKTASFETDKAWDKENIKEIITILCESIEYRIEVDKK